MKKLLLAGVAFGALIAGPAMAADLAPRPVYRAPVIAAPVYSWAGFYIGVNAGGGMAFGTVEDKDCFFCAGDSFQQGFAEVGGQIGYNWQFGSAVLGVEADWNWNSLDHSGLYGLDDNPSVQASLKLNSFGSVRARAGLAFQNTLVYVTAGPAWGHLQGSATPFCRNSLGCTGDQMPFASTSQWNWGLLGGAGVEIMITPNVSLRGEYLVLALADSVVDDIVIPSPNIGCTVFDNRISQQCRTSFRVSEQIARIGLNYKFGYAPALAAYK